MRFFTCVVDPAGRGIPEKVCRAYDAFPRRRDLEFGWQHLNHMALLTGWDDPYGGPLVAQAHDDDWVAIGMVRLDNRVDLARWLECRDTDVTDLELVRRAIARHGTQRVSHILGDFAFVAWNGRMRTAVAACDAFAVQKLYYAERDGLVVFASRAEALALEERYEVRYLAELVALRDRPRDLSVYAGVRSLPRASMAVCRCRGLTIQSYWSATDVAMEPSWAGREQEATEVCRHLLIESVRQRVLERGGTWAQLSGGLDSSSIVSVAQWLAGRGEISRGLDGTVSFIDHHGTGTDEREYSDAVARRWQLRNEAIIDPPTWCDDRFAPPHTDQPRGDLHVYPRDRRLCAIVRAAGGRVLLTGIGGDELFTGNMLFFADWLVHGRVWSAVREMARRAAIGRVSFWELAYRNALLPLLPRAMHARLVHDQYEVPTTPWLKRAMVCQYGLDARSYSAPAYGGRLGQKYHHAVVSAVSRLESPTAGGVLADALDVRHPMLYRPLVEFALRLPPELLARPHSRRWLLREAMRGILPEQVRTRVGKPGTADFLMWSLAAQRTRLVPLVQHPILADLGVVDPSKLRAAFDAVFQGTTSALQTHGALFQTLAVEAWLQIRSGRWPHGNHPSVKHATNLVHQPSV